MKFGWYGPYVNVGFEPGAYLVDGWGTPLRLQQPRGAGQIRSEGPDRAFGRRRTTWSTPPPRSSPPGGFWSTCTCGGRTTPTSQYLLNPQPGSFPAMGVNVHDYSNNGSQASVSATDPARPRRTRSTAYHAGLHAVTATCTLPPNPAATGQAVVYMPENNQQAQVNLYLR